MPTCFVIMPVSLPATRVSEYGGDSDHFAHVLEHLFKPALSRLGYTAVPPVATGADVIHAEIIRNLETADLVLCDMSGHNPNVFFELGIRTAVDRPVALVKDRLTTHVPFDTTLINHHTYDHGLSPWMLDNEIQQLADHLLGSVNGSEGRNTLWKYFGLTSRAALPNSASIDEKLSLILQFLEKAKPSPESVGAGDSSAVSQQPSSSKVLAFLERAQSIASEVSAPLSVESIADSEVVLDLRNYILPQDLRDRIALSGAAQGIRVGFQGGFLTVDEKKAALPE